MPARSGSASVAALGVLGAAPAALFAIGVLAQAGSSLPWIEFLACVLALVVANGAFVAGETALNLLRESDAEGELAKFWAKRQHYAAACFLGSQTSRAWIVISALVPASWSAPTVASWGVPPGWPSVLVGTLLLAIPISAVNVVAGEVFPRTLASVDPPATVRRLRGLIVATAFVATPLVRLAVATASLATRRFGARASFTVGGQAEQQIRGILAAAGDGDGIDEEERSMIHSVFEFGDTVAREVMTPRVDMDALPIDASLEDVARLVEETGHSRIPVYMGTEDHIVGTVHAKDVLSELVAQRNRSLREIMREPYFVPENKDLHQLLTEMRAAKAQIVIVQDEFGGTAGVVTVEDIVEEVVGEIVDEYDEEQPEVVPLAEGVLAEGRTNLYDLNEAADTRFASDEFDTIGGYVFGLFGRQPAEGESIEDDGFRFTVVETDGRRIVRVRIEPLPQPVATLGQPQPEA
jgi:putative hemolysin